MANIQKIYIINLEHRVDRRYCALGFHMARQVPFDLIEFVPAFNGLLYDTDPVGEGRERLLSDVSAADIALPDHVIPIVRAHPVNVFRISQTLTFAKILQSILSEPKDHYFIVLNDEAIFTKPWHTTMSAINALHSLYNPIPFVQLAPTTQHFDRQLVLNDDWSVGIIGEGDAANFLNSEAAAWLYQSIMDAPWDLPEVHIWKLPPHIGTFSSMRYLCQQPWPVPQQDPMIDFGKNEEGRRIPKYRQKEAQDGKTSYY